MPILVMEHARRRPRRNHKYNYVRIHYPAFRQSILGPLLSPPYRSVYQSIYVRMRKTIAERRGPGFEATSSGCKGKSMWWWSLTPGGGGRHTYHELICDRVRQNQPYVGQKNFPFFAYSKLLGFWTIVQSFNAIGCFVFELWTLFCGPF